MLKILLKRWFLIPPLLLLVVVTPLFFFWFHIGAHASQQAMTGTHHYFYDFPNGYMNVYDMDNNFALVQSVQLPTTNVRGVVFDPNSGMLYFSNGGNGGGNGNGGLIKYNLVTQQVVYNVSYNFGVDSMAITPDGKTIFMPDGSMSSDGTWHIIDTANGQVTGTLLTTSGLAPHDTDMSANGQYVYMEGVDNTYIWVANTATDQIVQKVGPFAGRARPFVVNQSGTLVYTTENGLIGFGVGNLQTGQVLYNVSAPGFNLPPGFDKVNVTPSHGISLSPDGKTVYVIDVPNSYVHVFDVSGLPSTAPTMTASIPISPVTGSEPNCHIDCTREGWLEQSLDGHYLFVGNSGSIIDTTTNKVVANLATLDDTRMFLEIDWVNGVPVNSEDRTDFYWNNPSPPTPTPSSTITPSPSPTLGTLLAQDTFQRANQKYWGTASDGLTWGGDANTLSPFSIANNTGLISNSNGAYNAVLGPSTTDAEVLFTGSISSFTNNNLGAVLRWQNTNNWYKAYIDGSHLIIQSKVNGTLTTLAQIAFTAQANTLYDLRFRIVGSTLYAKAWAASTPEPTNWMATATSTALTSGQCGLRIQISTNTTATITSFQATSA